jgi:hypothetical protein
MPKAAGLGSAIMEFIRQEERRNAPLLWNGRGGDIRRQGKAPG